LNETVQDILALIHTIRRMQQDADASFVLDSAATERRIAVLSKAHALLAGAELQVVSVNDVMMLVMDTLGVGGDRMALSGPDVRLRPASALILALLSDELVANASQFGALVNDAGRIDIKWASDVMGVRLTWTEHAPRFNGQTDRKRGFGSILIVCVTCQRDDCRPDQRRGVRRKQCAQRGRCANRRHCQARLDCRG